MTNVGEKWSITSFNYEKSWNAICYGNNLYVALSASGRNVMVSSDAIEWSMYDIDNDNYWTSLCYANGLFVAVSRSGEKLVMTSPDAINWTLRTCPINIWRSVCYGNDLFVAVGESDENRIMTSPDGVNWTSRTAPVNNQWISVCYGNGLFVAVSNSGSGDRIMTSINGVDWVSQISPANNNWVSVCFGNNLFVASSITGSGNRIMISSDGFNWTTQQTTDEIWRSICFGNNLFVVVSESGDKRAMTSPNGVDWTLQNLVAANAWKSVCYGNGKYVGVSFDGYSDRIAYSLDGQTWKITITAVPWSSWRSACYGRDESGGPLKNGLFVAIANNIPINLATSTDGYYWIRRDIGGGNWSCVCYGNGMFVAVSNPFSNIKIGYSYDGQIWETIDSPYNYGNVCSGYVDGQHVFSATGYNCVGRSFDGINWEFRTIPGFVTNLGECCYQNGIFVVFGGEYDTNYVWSPINGYSYDGINWTYRYDFTYTFYSVCYGGDKFVAVSYDGYAIYSYDGINWTFCNNVGKYPWKGVRYGDNTFVAICEAGGVVMTSKDGINWSLFPAAGDYSWQTLTYGNGLFLSFGRNFSVENGQKTLMVSGNYRNLYTENYADLTSSYKKLYSTVKTYVKMAIFTTNPTIDNFMFILSENGFYYLTPNHLDNNMFSGNYVELPEGYNFTSFCVGCESISNVINIYLYLTDGSNFCKYQGTYNNAETIIFSEPTITNYTTIKFLSCSGDGSIVGYVEPKPIYVCQSTNYGQTFGRKLLYTTDGGNTEAMAYTISNQKINGVNGSLIIAYRVFGSNYFSSIYSNQNWTESSVQSPGEIVLPKSVNIVGNKISNLTIIANTNSQTFNMYFLTADTSTNYVFGYENIYYTTNSLGNAGFKWIPTNVIQNSLSSFGISSNLNFYISSSSGADGYYYTNSQIGTNTTFSNTFNYNANINKIISSIDNMYQSITINNVCYILNGELDNNTGLIFNNYLEDIISMQNNTIFMLSSDKLYVNKDHYVYLYELYNEFCCSSDTAYLLNDKLTTYKNNVFTNYVVENGKKIVCSFNDQYVSYVSNNNTIYFSHDGLTNINNMVFEEEIKANIFGEEINIVQSGYGLWVNNGNTFDYLTTIDKHIYNGYIYGDNLYYVTNEIYDDNFYVINYKTLETMFIKTYIPSFYLSKVFVNDDDVYIISSSKGRYYCYTNGDMTTITTNSSYVYDDINIVNDSVFLKSDNIVIKSDLYQ